uniref:Uncharacterized protein n=1 Tax=Oryzias latipes TaxID=8090 RepID=A0A3P9II13_ORYLA
MLLLFPLANCSREEQEDSLQTTSGVSAMTDIEVSFEDFIASRRSGRRNAIHEIPTEKLQGSMDLSQRLAQLTISKNDSKNEEKKSI